MVVARFGAQLGVIGPLLSNRVPMWTIRFFETIDSSSLFHHIIFTCLKKEKNNEKTIQDLSNTKKHVRIQ